MVIFSTISSLALVGETENRSGASTDGQLINLWLTGRSKETTSAYERDLKSFFVHIQNKPTKEVTLDDVNGFVSVYSSGKAPSSVNRMISVLKSFFAFAQRTGYTKFNVAAPVRLVKMDRRGQVTLTVDDVGKIINACKTEQEKLIVTLLFQLGLRATELCQIRAQDVSPNPKGSRVAILGKGGKTRFMQVDKKTSKAIKMHIKRLRIESSDSLFYTNGGSVLNRNSLWRLIKALAKRADITKKVTPHTFRHSMCTVAIQNGAPVALVSKTLGHSTVAVTSRYIHMNENLSVGSFLTGGGSGAAETTD